MSQFSWGKKNIRKQNTNIFVYRRMSGWRNSKMLLVVIDGWWDLAEYLLPSVSLCMLCWALEEWPVWTEPMGLLPCPLVFSWVHPVEALGNWREGGGQCWILVPLAPYLQNCLMLTKSLKWRSQFLSRGFPHTTLSCVLETTTSICP